MTSRGNFRKLDGRVAFPLDLDLTPYMAWPAGEEPRRVLYRLSGTVVHSGSLGGGHYIAYVRTPKGWFTISDGHVSLVAESAVAACQAYLLFYQQVPGGASGSVPAPPAAV